MCIRDRYCLSSSHVQHVIKDQRPWVITLSREVHNFYGTGNSDGVVFIDLNYSAISELCDQNSIGDKGYVFIPVSYTHLDFAGFEEKFCNLVKEAKVVAMSGSVPKGLDGTAYQRLIKIVKEAGIPVILDTSGKLLEMGIDAAPTMIKPTIDEIRMLTGKKCDNIQDIIDAAKEIHAKGVEIVAVSLGADGSLCLLYTSLHDCGSFRRCGKDTAGRLQNRLLYDCRIA